MIAEIVLTAGTRFLPFDDVPKLIARTIHPPVAVDAPTVIGLVAKMTILADGWPDKNSVRPLAEKDAQFLSRVWAGLPHWIGRTMEEWPKYVDAFKRIEPDVAWIPIPILYTESVVDQYRAATESECEQVLRVAVDRGELVVRSPVTHLPQVVAWGEQLTGSLLLVADLVKFLAPLDIAIRIEDQEDANPVGSSPTTRSAPGVGERRGLTKKQLGPEDWPVLGGFQLSRALSDPPEWLKTALEIRGSRQGRRPNTWDLVQLAVCLCSQGKARKNALTKHIKASFPGFADAWEDAAEHLT